MLLVTIKPTPLSIWRWCSGFSLLLGFVSAFLSRRRFSELGPTGIKDMGAYRYVFYMTGVLGWNQPAGVNINIANIPLPTAEERAEMRALDAKLDAIAAKLKA
jgi:hypothetical protein